MLENKTLITTITKTSLLLAILIVAQVVTKSLGQIVTGSVVNLILAVSALTLGIQPSIIIGLVSPFMAFLLGIGTPIIQIVPIIAFGNIVYVVGISLLLKRNKNTLLKLGIMVAIAFGKFITLYCLITKVVLPLLNLPEAKVKALSLAFSYPQLITALIGGFIAIEIVPIVQKAFRK